ncbi:11669_t:CDS:2 [Dentiscutata erythropus]|uniref:11669_t:CDS:1 n=1 Tax=Dentiscutata erythropus TaxID=1348616 RepID=A0A9N9C5W8_9GLOM|nr:11669_t:CDS:2 [Dentiscutata erythropus]
MFSTRNGIVFNNIIQSLDLSKDEKRIKAKATEISSQMDVKIGSAPGFKDWTICKPIYAVHIALRIPFDRKRPLKLANTTEQNYHSSLSYIRKRLEIPSLISFDSLATRFGCPKIIPYVETMFEIFKEEWVKDLSAANIKEIDWNDDIYKVAVFGCCCKVFGAQSRISQQLINSPDISISRLAFQNMTRLIEKYCKSYINELKSQIKNEGLMTFMISPVKGNSYINEVSEGRSGTMVCGSVLNKYLFVYMYINDVLRY